MDDILAVIWGTCFYKLGKEIQEKNVKTEFGTATVVEVGLMTKANNKLNILIDGLVAEIV